ncbi:MAG: ribonuclease J [Thermoplasmata archaeon]|nr:MAG: RNase J family beta-CASP ribonuclease [Thermoplasmata archaeon]RLF64619.1 MAG: ribonuclease J [Thermoplasmata archaeon]
MDIVLHAVGGYDEVGRNMTCLEIGDEAVIIDMGLYLDRYVPLQDDEEKLTYQKLVQEDAIPNDGSISHLRKKIKAIILSHAHLDHIGAVRWMASRYNCPILSTPYTIEILKKMKQNKSFELKNKLITINPNSTYRISKNIGVEFIHVTHSIIQASMVNISLPQGNILYSLDYKFDNHPIVGSKTNKKRLKQLAKENVIALILDSTNAEEEKKTFSESVAKEMLRDVLLGMETEGHAIIVTTFASHIARLKSIFDMGKQLGREIVFVGRSLNDYIGAAEKLKFVNFSKNAEMIKSTFGAKKKLKEMHENREKYMIVATGGQGEPNATMSKMVNGEIPFTILPEDFIVFACGVIPTPTIQANRKILEHKLHNRKARMLKDIHVSGHASREDLRDLIKIVSPDIIIPAHGNMQKLASAATLASEMGYRLGKDVYLLQNGQNVTIE